MSYATVLAHVADPRRTEGLLAAAADIAERNNSHLIGLNVLPPPVLIPAADSGATVIIDQHRDAYRQDLPKLKAAFDNAVRLRGLAAEWQAIDSGYLAATSQVIQHGRNADLIVVNQKDDAWGLSGHLEGPDQVVLDTGRPVLVVANAWRPAPLGKRILIAWNGRREAARAVFDAIPLLKAADTVIVTWINPQRESEAAGDVPASDICTALARHGVKCEAAAATAASGSVGETLLSLVASTGADLLVMGCYGHSRLREFVIGGASRHVLQNMAVPVLMSH